MKGKYLYNKRLRNKKRGIYISSLHLFTEKIHLVSFCVALLVCNLNRNILFLSLLCSEISKPLDTLKLLYHATSVLWYIFHKSKLSMKYLKKSSTESVPIFNSFKRSLEPKNPHEQVEQSVIIVIIQSFTPTFSLPNR